MARHATDPGLKVDGMVKIDKLRKIVDAVPAQWLTGVQARRNRLQSWRTAQNHLVAIHAGLRCWKTGKSRFFNGSMAKPAVQAQLRMALMVEGEILFRGGY